MKAAELAVVDWPSIILGARVPGRACVLAGCRTGVGRLGGGATGDKRSFVVARRHRRTRPGLNIAA